MVQEIKFVFLSLPVLFHAAYFHLEQIFFFWEEEKKKKAKSGRVMAAKLVQ